MPFRYQDFSAAELQRRVRNPRRIKRSYRSASGNPGGSANRQKYRRDKLSTNLTAIPDATFRLRFPFARLTFNTCYVLAFFLEFFFHGTRSVR